MILNSKDDWGLMREVRRHGANLKLDFDSVKFKNIRQRLVAQTRESSKPVYNLYHIVANQRLTEDHTSKG